MRLGVPQGRREEADAGRTQAKGAVQEVFATAERMAADLESDVLWMSEGTERMPPRLCVAPLQVWGPMRDKLLTDKTVVFTSATLMLGGDFTSVATSVGLKPSERVVEGPTPDRTDDAMPWRGLDVGSPFDYGRQAILYVARHLPPPGRDGLARPMLDEIVELVDAADGRTLGLFSSRRAAEAAAEVVRERLPHLTTLAQGDAQLPELAAQFVGDPHTCLFGTLSLWQGLDVPGDTCQLVLIDRIPFPRPDDPLLSARQKAADQAGGNGFMQVAATHAALLLAQGAGRLIRTHTDRGVVAVLDPRLATARYGGFLKASLPPMWTTTDPAVVRQALTRLAAPLERRSAVAGSRNAQPVVAGGVPVAGPVRPAPAAPVADAGVGQRHVDARHLRAPKSTVVVRVAGPVERRCGRWSGAPSAWNTVDDRTGAAGQPGQVEPRRSLWARIEAERSKRTVRAARWSMVRLTSRCRGGAAGVSVDGPVEPGDRVEPSPRRTSPRAGGSRRRTGRRSGAGRGPGAASTRETAWIE